MKHLSLFLVAFLIVSLVLNLQIGEKKALANSNTDELRFAVISDLHHQASGSYPTVNQEMLRSIMEYDPAFIIDLGDWLQNVLGAFNDAQDETVTYANTTIFQVIGNHDERGTKDGNAEGDDPAWITPDEWRDETAGGEHVYSMLRDNILLIFLGSGTNNEGNFFIRYRVRRFVEYLVYEKYPNQTLLFFCHHYMNDTMVAGQQYPQYTGGFWADTEIWLEQLMNNVSSRTIAWFVGHVHYDLWNRYARWNYGAYWLPCGDYGSDQFFRTFNVTASGWTTRVFTYNNVENATLRMDNSTSTTFNNTIATYIDTPIWLQDDSDYPDIGIFQLAENRKLELIGVYGNETMIQQDAWMQSFTGDYNVSGAQTTYTWYNWLGANYADDYWFSLEDDDGSYKHQILAIKVNSSDGEDVILETRSWMWDYFTYYNISCRIRADQNLTDALFWEEDSSNQLLYNMSVTTEWQWFHSTSNAECIYQVSATEIQLKNRENATYYIDAVCMRMNNDYDNHTETTDNPSVTINGDTYNYTGTLNPLSSYSYDYPFPSTDYDDITSVSVGGNKEVMVNIESTNPTWRVTNSWVNNGTLIATDNLSTTYNNTRVINYIDRSPANPQFMLMKGEIENFTEPTWNSNILYSNVSGTGAGIFRVDVATEGNATSITDDGTPISWTYNSAHGIIEFNVTLGSEHDIEVTWEAGGQTYKEYPSINLVFSLAHTTIFYGTYTIASSINLVFSLASTVSRYGLFKVNPAIVLTFAVNSIAVAYRVFTGSHSINLVFALASTAEVMAEGILHVYPSIILDFALSSISTFTQHYYNVWSSIELIFQLTSTSAIPAIVAEVSQSGVVAVILIALLISLPLVALIVWRKQWT